MIGTLNNSIIKSIKDMASKLAGRPLSEDDLTSFGAACRLVKSGRPMRRGRTTIYDYEKLAKEIDWTKSDPENARIHNIDVTHIGNMRRRLGISVVPSANRRIEVWKTWDWTKKDAELAEEHALCRERVRQIRMKLGLPTSMETRLSRLEMRRRKFETWLAGRKEVSLKEALVETRFNDSTIRRMCKEMGVLLTTRYHTRWPWELVNWDLGSRTIELAWGMPRNVAASYRYRSGKKGCSGKYVNDTLSPEFVAECEKAEQWRAERGIIHE